MATVLTASLVFTAPAVAHKPHEPTVHGKRYTTLYKKVEHKPKLTKGLPKPVRLKVAHLRPKRQRQVRRIIEYRIWPSQYKAMLKRKKARAIKRKLSAPPGWAAQWSSVSFCESGNRPHISGDYYGKWQFHKDTWGAYKDWASRWPYAHLAPEWAQDGAAWNLWRASGYTFADHWPVCGRGK